MKWLGHILSSISGLTDEQAMWRVLANDDHEAFAELVRRWEPPVRALCIRMTGDDRFGDDLAQETFVRVFASLPPPAAALQRSTARLRAESSSAARPPGWLPSISLRVLPRPRSRLCSPPVAPPPIRALAP